MEVSAIGLPGVAAADTVVHVAGRLCQSPEVSVGPIHGLHLPT
jgi:hypothetical protein